MRRKVKLAMKSIENFPFSDLQQTRGFYEL